MKRVALACLSAVLLSLALSACPPAEDERRYDWCRDSPPGGEDHGGDGPAEDCD